jgi:hypothetical protein
VRPSNTTLKIACLVVAVFAAASMGSSASGTAFQNDPIELRNPYFDWVGVVEQGATYEWSVDVTNNTAAPVRLQVILDLLDDDDRPVNRDDQNTPFDVVIITVEPGQSMPVEQQGTISYDRAAEVVTYRHRHRVLQ